jgi:hypothetical protein
MSFMPFWNTEQASLKKISEEAKEQIEKQETDARSKKKAIDDNAKLQKSDIEKGLTNPHCHCSWVLAFISHLPCFVLRCGAFLV